MKIGIAGLGHIGKNHARILAELPQCELAAVFDTDADTAREIAEKYGARATATLEEFSDVIEAATIATPTPTHFAIAGQLLKAGKHLLVEKPITETAEDARKLVELSQQAGRILQVGHVERFNPVMSKLEELLTEPRFIEAHRLSPYPNRSIEIGVVLDLMIHDLEIILHLVRSPVTSIDAVGVPVLSRGEDIATVRLHFENGCVANVTASRISPEKLRKIRVFQREGYVSLDYQNQTGEIYRLGPGGIVREAVEIEKDEPLKRELASFIECAKQGKQPKVSGYEGAAALELAVEITRRIEVHAATYYK
ncbi:MAG TPA: Gfo/Idh/MocA family oxidoreductase [Chthoniobacteraceae bacterium]|jgi:predicted dehydrogenase|nr:Gfo/Idh/MocA family oxidoreductase [Chthoniobacteraceae bacterium]